MTYDTTAPRQRSTRLALAAKLAASLALPLALAACGGGESPATASSALSSATASSAAASATRSATELAAAAPRALPPLPPALPPPPPALPPAPPQAGLSANAPIAAADLLLSPRARLGKQIFFDPNLSEPRGTPCAACHSAARGFAGNHGSGIGVAQGSLPSSIGLRNAMSNAYAAYIPHFGFRADGADTEPFGGLFWDGRSETPALQALGPLLNPLEMNNKDSDSVVKKIAAAPYAAAFKSEFGASIFSDPANAFANIGVAIAAYEQSPQLAPFSSKYDAMIRGKASLAPAEARGMALFRDPKRANCSGCHAMNPSSPKPQDSLFTDFGYYAEGIPRNAAIPNNSNPNFYDLGLCGPNRTAPIPPSTLSQQELCGKFRMPSLRNVAERPAFMHNGKFKSLKEVVHFYSTRDSNPQLWYGNSGIPNDLPPGYQANIERSKAPFNRPAHSGPLLTPQEIDDLVAFMGTLSDGFTP